MSTNRVYSTFIARKGLFASACTYAALNLLTQNHSRNEANVTFDENIQHGDEAHTYETHQMITNWSGTHTCHPKRIYYPISSLEVQSVLEEFQRKQKKIRVVGTALSPNGIGMSDKDGSLLSVANLDNISVDVDKMEVTVGAGATVSNVLKELKRHGLTLQNFSSIQEQQMAGWTQVAAHGTGCTLPTVDEMILSLEIVTPAFGLTRIDSKDFHPGVVKSDERFFRFAKVAVGSLGVVTQLTLKCIPEITLREETAVLDRTKIDTQAHIDRLKSFRHVRYMWVPYTNTVVSVVSNPTTATDVSTPTSNQESVSNTEFPTRALVDLALNITNSNQGSLIANKESEDDIRKKSFSQLRDLILDHAPLDTEHIVRTNAAEAQFWAASQGSRVDSSTNILGFDCGGEQWVYEVCIPMGPLADYSSKDTKDNKDVSSASGVSRDIEFVQRLLALIEENKIPAPSPIEQRWTASSTAYMSPAHSPNRDDVFTWVGIIMYLPPSQTPAQRDAIAARFREYCRLIDPLVREYGGYPHWAKIELPESKEELQSLRAYLRQKYPVEQFVSYRRTVDPNNILSNNLVDLLFNDDNDS